jgi:hypothetical protein
MPLEGPFLRYSQPFRNIVPERSYKLIQLLDALTYASFVICATNVTIRVIVPSELVTVFVNSTLMRQSAPLSLPPGHSRTIFIADVVASIVDSIASGYLKCTVDVELS